MEKERELERRDGKISVQKVVITPPVVLVGSTKNLSTITAYIDLDDSMQRIESKQRAISKYSINVMPGKTIEAELVSIPLDKIKLDTKNVRFRHLFKELSDEEMEKIIWKESATKEWYTQIKFAEGLSDRPIVQSVKDHYVVREGNARIVCLRRLKKAILEKEENIPLKKIDPQQCVVLPKVVTEKEIAIYLTRIHVGSKTPWAAFNKAGQIFDLYTIHNLTYDIIAKSCGVGKATAMRMVLTYKALLDYFDKYPDNKDIKLFSYFYEFYKLERKLKKEGMENWPKENVDLFMGWVHNEQIVYGKQVRVIPKIITDKEAYQVLLNGGTMENAIKVREVIDPTVGSILYKRLSKLMETLDGFSYEEMVSTAENPNKLRYLKELRKKIDVLIANIESIQKAKKKLVK